MVKHTNLIFWLILGGMCVHFSCNLVDLNQFKFSRYTSGASATAVPALTHNTDTVNVDIFVVRLAPHQNALLRQLWQEVDEQSLSPQLRRELYAQGFRAGILGSLLSPALAQLLTVSSDANADVSWGVIYEISSADAAREPTATRNMRNLLPGMSALVKVFDTPLPEQSLFWEENGMTHGQTYTDVLGLLGVSATANRDGSAQIQIVPELEHGIEEQRVRIREAMFIHESGKPRRSLESLTVSQRLLPGQWLIVGTTSPDSAGVGKTFFVRKDTGLEQRFLAIRLISATTTATTSRAAPPNASRESESMMPERN